MFKAFRLRLWSFFLRWHTVGTLLPWWLVAIRAVLFPLSFFYWRLSKHNGYQYETDSWLIHGVRYSGDFFRTFSLPSGDRVFRFARENETIIIEQVDLGDKGLVFAASSLLSACCAFVQVRREDPEALARAEQLAHDAISQAYKDYPEPLINCSKH